MTTNEMPRLTGITSEAGECDSCGRELGRVYEVRHPDGTVATYGRKCCAKVTGYKATAIDREARMAARQVVIAARRHVVAAEFPQYVEWTGSGERYHYDAPRFTLEADNIIVTDYLWRNGPDEALARIRPFAA